jgi:hypothetical protein
MLPTAYNQWLLRLTTENLSADRNHDAIVEGKFLELLYPPDVDDTLSEFQHMHSISGTLLTSTPNPYPLNIRKQRGTVFAVAHLTKHFPKILKLRLLAHGLKKIRLIGSLKTTPHLGE